MSKPTDIRAKTPDELNTMLLDLRREQFNLRFQRATGQQEGTARIRAVRRDIARVKTILGEKNRGPGEKNRGERTRSEPQRSAGQG